MQQPNAQGRGPQGGMGGIGTIKPMGQRGGELTLDELGPMPTGKNVAQQIKGQFNKPIVGANAKVNTTPKLGQMPKPVLGTP